MYVPAHNRFTEPDDWAEELERSAQAPAEVEGGGDPDAELKRQAAWLRVCELRIAQWERLRAQAREEIGLTLARFYNNKAALPGLGRLELRAPSVARVWDTGALSELAQSLREQGQTEIAAEIEACKRETARAGSLAVRWDKVGEEAEG